MRIGTTFELNNKSLEKAVRAKLTDLVFHHLHPEVTPELLQVFTLHNTGKLTPDGKNYAYTKVKNEIEQLEARFPNLFNYRSFQFKYALIKDIYWSLIIDNLIEQKCNELTIHSSKIIRLDPAKSPLLELFKFFLRLVKPVQLAQINSTAISYKNKIAVRINSVSSLGYFGKLPETLGWENTVSFQSSLADKRNETAIFLTQRGFLNYSFTRHGKLLILDSLKFFPLLFSTRIRFLNLLLDTKRKQIATLSEYEVLAKLGVKSFLLCASENEGEGIVASLVAKKYKLKSFNFMNGTKAKDLINSYTAFDYWFMHDQKMQEMLCTISNQKAENFPVVGHLMQDVAQTHSYSGTLDAYNEELKGKKIIALFTSNTYGIEQWDVLTLLKKLLERNKDIVVLIRQHPDEKHPIETLHPRMILLPSTKEKNNLALFDLLQQAHLAISFGSTVSLQASWFGVPSATVEYAQKSLLLYVDDEKIKHFNSIEMLASFIDNRLSFPAAKSSMPTAVETVAQKMAAILLQ